MGALRTLAKNVYGSFVGRLLNLSGCTPRHFSQFGELAIACCVQLPVKVLQSIFHEQKKVTSFFTRGNARVTTSYCKH